jgi:C1A family cysteine protease
MATQKSSSAAKPAARKPAAKSTQSAAVVDFSDRVLNVLPSRETESDWDFTNALTASVTAAAAPPASTDLREAWWNIGDQGQTGSCVGWATADSVMRYLLVKAGRLEPAEQLSARFVWMASKETDHFVDRPESFIEEAGTSLKAAADICRKFGVVTEALLNFQVNTLMYTGRSNDFYAAASTRRAANYFNLFKDLNEWKKWLANTGPILAALRVDSSWLDATSTQGELKKFKPGPNQGGHAIAIVGYTAKHFIIRNSWGTAWGKDGFGFATPEYIKDAFFNESFGLTL